MVFDFLKKNFKDTIRLKKDKGKTSESNLSINRLEKISKKYQKDEMNYVNEISNMHQDNREAYSIENSIQVYKTDINTQICNCQDWNKTRKGYNYNDPRRLCKHLIHLLDTENLNNELVYFKENIEYYKVKTYAYKKQSFKFETIINLLNKYKAEINFNNEWINIYTKDGLKYGILFDSYGNIYWANNLEKPNDYKEIEIELFKILFEHIISLTDEEKEKISNLINTKIFDISVKDKRETYLVYCVNCDSDRAYDDDYQEAYIEDLYFHNIIVDNKQIFISLKSTNYLIERNYGLNKIEADKRKNIKLTELLENHKISQD